MSANIEKIKKSLQELISRGYLLEYALIMEEGDARAKKNCREFMRDVNVDSECLPNFSTKYELWYTNALNAVKVLIPDRLNDFILLYKNEKRKGLNTLTYTISDAVIGISKDYADLGPSNAIPKLLQQVSILSSAEESIDSILFGIQFSIRADLFDSEIDAANELFKNGFLRSAGALCGVILEKHFTEVCSKHNIKITKKKPTINDFNGAMKDNVIDTVMWRKIQQLADIRNLCDHNGEREPTKDDIQELLIGTDKIIKTLF